MISSKHPVRAYLERFGHILAGLLILLKSSIVGEHHPLLGGILLILGALFVLVAIFHHKLQTRLPLTGERLLFLLEAFALFVVAYEMIAEHKKYLQYAYCFAASVYLVLAAVLPRLRKFKKQTAVAHL